MTRPDQAFAESQCWGSDPRWHLGKMIERYPGIPKAFFSETGITGIPCKRIGRQLAGSCGPFGPARGQVAKRKLQVAWVEALLRSSVPFSEKCRQGSPKTYLVAVLVLVHLLIPGSGAWICTWSAVLSSVRNFTQPSSIETLAPRRHISIYLHHQHSFCQRKY